VYDKEFWDRLNLRKILEYVRTGREFSEEDISGTAEQKYTHYYNKLISGMSLSRDRIIAFDWNSLNGDDLAKSEKTHDIFGEVMEASSDLSDLAFEMGFIAGLKVLQDISKYSPKTT